MRLLSFVVGVAIFVAFLALISLIIFAYIGIGVPEKLLEESITRLAVASGIYSSSLDTNDLQIESARLAVDLAARNTSWASFLVSALGVVFVVLSISLAFYVETADARITGRLRRFQREIEKSEQKFRNWVAKSEDGMRVSVIQVAEFCRIFAYLELQDKSESRIKNDRLNLLLRTIYSCTEIILSQSTSIEEKKTVIRDLVKIPSDKTEKFVLKLLQEIELIGDGAIQGLLLKTRQMIRDNLKS